MRYSEWGMARLLKKRLGLSRQKARPRQPQGSAAERAAFEKGAGVEARGDRRRASGRPGPAPVRGWLDAARSTASARRAGSATAGTSAASARPAWPTGASAASTCSPPAGPARTRPSPSPRPRRPPRAGPCPWRASPESRARRARRAGPRPGRLAPRAWARRAGQHHARPAAILPARAQPGRTSLALRARAFPLAPRAGELHRPARGRLPRLERPRRRARPARQPHRLPLPTPVRTSVSGYDL